MKIFNNFNLKKLNAFKTDTLAKYFVEISTLKELEEILKNQKLIKENIFLIGDGTNTLFTKKFDGLVIKVNILGKRIIEDNDECVILEVGAGEDWHKLVMYTVEHEWSGLENLAYIPGTVGAAPVQNIAAYGQNFGDSVEYIRGYNLNNFKFETITAKECKFYYRDSIFKNRLKNKFVVTSVILKLYKTPHFDVNYFGSKPYESLETEIKKLSPNYPNEPLTPKIVAQAVINQRTIKLPDWHKVGTAGSFFKNPFVTKNKYKLLKKEIPDLQTYPVDKMLYPNPDDPVLQMSDKVKIPAGKLLDTLGWRGKNIGKVGTFEKHALIVVSQSGAKAKDILNFTNSMKEDVHKHFNVDLEEEVNII